MTKPGKFAFMARKSQECAEEALTVAETFRDPETRRTMLKSANNEAFSQLKGQQPGLFLLWSRVCIYLRAGFHTPVYQSDRPRGILACRTS